MFKYMLDQCHQNNNNLNSYKNRAGGTNECCKPIKHPHLLVFNIYKLKLAQKQGDLKVPEGWN